MERVAFNHPARLTERLDSVNAGSAVRPGQATLLRIAITRAVAGGPFSLAIHCRERTRFVALGQTSP